MRCISIAQPWAWAILQGHKTVENRTWYTPYRGPILIHASKSSAYQHAIEDLRAEGYDVPDMDELPQGAILGQVELVNVVEYERGEFYNDYFASGPYCFLLGEVRAFREPIPWRGLQKIFHVPDEAVTEALAACR